MTTMTPPTATPKPATPAQIAAYRQLCVERSALLAKEVHLRAEEARLKLEIQIADFRLAAQKKSYDKLLNLHFSLLRCADFMPSGSHPGPLEKTASDLRREFCAITDCTERAQFFQVFGEQMTTI